MILTTDLMKFLKIS